MSGLFLLVAVLGSVAMPDGQNDENRDDGTDSEYEQKQLTVLTTSEEPSCVSWLGMVCSVGTADLRGEICPQRQPQ